MRELSPTQIAVIERLAAHQFSPMLLPLYLNAIGVRRGPYAVLLAPVDSAGFRIFSEPCYVIDGNLSVRVKRGGRQWFVWKSKQVEATAELLAGLEQFSSELAKLLQ
jgi:hypothetical protein